MLTPLGDLRFGPDQPVQTLPPGHLPPARSPLRACFFAIGLKVLEVLGDRVYAVTGGLFLLLLGLLGLLGCVVFGPLF
jgi:hypothetical protein